MAVKSKCWNLIKNAPSFDRALGVELVGIEPTSGQDGDKPSTCVVYY